PPARAHDDVRAPVALGVQPQVARARYPEGHGVVLAGAPAHDDLEAVRVGEAHPDGGATAAPGASARPLAGRQLIDQAPQARGVRRVERPRLRPPPGDVRCQLGEPFARSRGTRLAPPGAVVTQPGVAGRVVPRVDL